MEHDVQRHRVELDANDRMQTLDHRYRTAQAERAVKERAELDARMNRILRTRHA
jgi:hypothetical protein